MQPQRVVEFGAVKKPALRPITMNATTGWRATMRTSAAIKPFWRYRAW
jgi:hypothetical protein